MTAFEMINGEWYEQYSDEYFQALEELSPKDAGELLNNLFRKDTKIVPQKDKMNDLHRRPSPQ